MEKARVVTSKAPTVAAHKPNNESNSKAVGEYTNTKYNGARDLSERDPEVICCTTTGSSLKKRMQKPGKCSIIVRVEGKENVFRYEGERKMTPKMQRYVPVYIG